MDSGAMYGFEMFNPIQDKGSITHGFVRSPCKVCEHAGTMDADECMTHNNCVLRPARTPLSCAIDEAKVNKGPREKKDMPKRTCEICSELYGKNPNESWSVYSRRKTCSPKCSQTKMLNRNKERNDKIINFVRAGMTYRDAGKMVGMSAGLVCSVIFRARERGVVINVPKKRPKKLVKPKKIDKYKERNDKIFALADEGYTHREIGEKLDISASCVCRAINK